ncbi:metallophosphoesterase family protein [Labrys wisconsinensis]|uniref:3',5'-cyclic AMP phosphodiesterase CpdA n=1 Tax=Labrys wisconsinensis TaxID=425677 RepID=A0ABU0JIX6_9HYPH|nr:metallophosphoesterase [Labrys wisconsinensis]MDQ0474222.1 3',5'-cyclic AMP phosphodiesterase CpdA [Labrys wisconsinensis]
MRVLHLSDPHLRHDDPASAARWLRLAAVVAELAPDLIVNTGDIVRDDPGDAADHAFAAQALRALGVEVLSVPGNHDVGDGPPSAPAPDRDLIARFRALHGPEHWLRPAGDWHLVGVNAMVLGTGMAEDAEEWAWLEAALAAAAPGPTALFLHKPPFLISPHEDTAISAAMPPAARVRLWDLARRHGVRLIGCGHRHEYRAVLHDGILTVWAPTTSALLDEATAPLEPRPFAGVVDYAFIGGTVVHRCIPLA